MDNSEIVKQIYECSMVERRTVGVPKKTGWMVNETLIRNDNKIWGIGQDVWINVWMLMSEKKIVRSREYGGI